MNGHLCLNELAGVIRDVNRANGWNVTQATEWLDRYKIPAVLALIHSEASEALEAFRNDEQEHFKEELIDILIRVLDLAWAFDFDLDAAILAKIDKNRHRGFHHGGKRI